MEKGQISIFVIIGVILVVLIIGFLYFKYSGNKMENINPEVYPLYSFFANCVKESEIKIIEEIGFTGGVYKKNKSLTWYFYEGEPYIPELKDIEENISSALKNELDNCFKDISDNYPEFHIQRREPAINAIIEDEKIAFDVSYPLTIAKGEKTFNLDEFNNEIEIRIGVIYNTAFKIIEDQLEHPNSICMTCWGKFAIENDIYVEAGYYDNNTLILTIRDENLKLNGKPYEFRFINRY